MNPQQLTDQLLQDLGFADAPDDQKQLVIQKVQQAVDDEIIFTIMSRLTDEQIERLDQEFTAHPEYDDHQKADRLVAIFKESLPDYEDIMARALDDLYNRLKGDADQAKAYLDAIHYQPPTTAANPAPEETPDTNY